MDQNCFTNWLEVRARERFWQEHWISTTTIQWIKVTLFLPNTLLELLIAVLMEPGFPSIPEQTWDSWAKNRWKVNTRWGTCNKPHCKSRPQIWARSLNLPRDKWHNFLRASYLHMFFPWLALKASKPYFSLISDVQSEECWKETSDWLFRLEHHRDHAQCVVGCYKSHFCICYFHWHFCK